MPEPVTPSGGDDASPKSPPGKIGIRLLIVMAAFVAVWGLARMLAPAITSDRQAPAFHLKSNCPVCHTVESAPS